MKFTEIRKKETKANENSQFLLTIVTCSNTKLSTILYLIVYDHKLILFFFKKKQKIELARLELLIKSIINNK